MIPPMMLDNEQIFIDCWEYDDNGACKTTCVITMCQPGETPQECEERQEEAVAARTKTHPPK